MQSIARAMDEKLDALRSRLQRMEWVGADQAAYQQHQNDWDTAVRDLNSILGHVESLGELDTTDVPPMAQVSDRYGLDESKQGSDRFAYASRDDVHEGLRKSLPQEAALANAPESDGTFFKVPKVIER